MKHRRAKQEALAPECMHTAACTCLVFAALKILVTVFVAVGKAESEEHLLRVSRETELKLELQVAAFLLMSWPPGRRRRRRRGGGGLSGMTVRVGIEVRRVFRVPVRALINV